MFNSIEAKWWCSSPASLQRRQQTHLQLVLLGFAEGSDDGLRVGELLRRQGSEERVVLSLVLAAGAQSLLLLGLGVARDVHPRREDVEQRVVRVLLEKDARRSLAPGPGRVDLQNQRQRH